MKISVIVVNWNRRELLRACLTSLSRQQEVDYEVIVVDNGSEDGSVELAREMGAHVIANAENRGFCEANNQGIKEARGEFIALLNNDAEAEPEWLLAQQRAFADPSVGMVACKVLVFEDPRRIDKVGHVIYPDGQNRGRGSGEIDNGQYDVEEEVLWPDGCACMYRKQMLDEIGGFDEDFFAYGDDAELGLRARIAGWRCIYVPSARVRHHRGSTLGLQSVRRLELIERNRVLLAVKLFPTKLLLLNPFYFSMRLLSGAWYSLRSVGETNHYPGLAGKMRMLGGIAMGDLRAVLDLPLILRKRRDVRKLQKLSDDEILALLRRYRAKLRELV
jgi:GT2 family glycosyltransferase